MISGGPHCLVSALLVERDNFQPRAPVRCQFFLNHVAFFIRHFFVQIETKKMLSG